MSIYEKLESIGSKVYDACEELNLLVSQNLPTDPDIKQAILEARYRLDESMDYLVYAISEIEELGEKFKE